MAGENNAAGPKGERNRVQPATNSTPQRHAPAGAVSSRTASSTTNASLASHAVSASAASLASPCDGGIVCTENSVSPGAQSSGGGVRGVQISKTLESRGPCPGGNNRSDTPCAPSNSAVRL